MRNILFVNFAAVLMMSGCLPSGGAQQGNAISLYHKESVNNISFVRAQKDHALTQWWSFSGDAALNKLMDAALMKNASDASQVTDIKDYDALVLLYNNPKAISVYDVSKLYLEYRYIFQKMRIIDGEKERYKNVLGVRPDVTGDVDSAQVMTMREREQKIILGLAKHTNLMPEYVAEILRENQPLPEIDLMPLFASEAEVFASAPAVRAAKHALLLRNKGLAQDRLQVHFTVEQLSQLFGISDQVYVSDQFSWRVKLGHAVRNVHLKEAELACECDADFDVFEQRIFSFLMEYEQKLVSYRQAQEQYLALQAAYERVKKETVAAQKYASSAPHFEEKERQARLAYLNASYERAKAGLALYEAFGVY